MLRTYSPQIHTQLEYNYDTLLCRRAASAPAGRQMAPPILDALDLCVAIIVMMLTFCTPPSRRSPYLGCDWVACLDKILKKRNS